jgi:hypothetical protein
MLSLKKQSGGYLQINYGSREPNFSKEMTLKEKR